MGCVKAVTDALTSLPGVASVKVDFGNKTASCAVADKKFVAKDALKSLKEAGFEKSKMLAAVNIHVPGMS